MSAAAPLAPRRPAPWALAAIALLALLRYLNAPGGDCPDYAAAAVGIGHVATLRGDEPRASCWYRHALRRDPAFAKATLPLGLRVAPAPDASTVALVAAARREIEVAVR